MREYGPDKIFLSTVTAIVLAGLFIFTSASFGLLARDGASFGDVAFNQLVLGLIGGAIVGFIFYKLPYKFFQRYSIYIFALSFLLTMLVFVPHLGFSFGGARRWIALGPISFQPAEFLKFGFVLMCASWFAAVRNKINSIGRGIGPLIIGLVFVAAVLLAQPDTGTFIIIFAAGVGIFLAAGGPWKHIGAILVVALLGITILAFIRPYVWQRIETFFNPRQDPLGSSYQLRQSLVAVGSGQLTGRGFGQSLQKFKYLPEPIGDSIFAVFAEEFGFIGGVLLIGLFTLLVLRVLFIAKGTTDTFGRLSLVGIAILFTAESFLNIGAMLGLVPLTGVPLVFVSHGGTALLFALAEAGFVLNVSRFQRT